MSYIQSMNAKLDLIYETLGMGPDFDGDDPDRNTFYRKSSMRHGFQRQNSQINPHGTQAPISVGALGSPQQLNIPFRGGGGLNKQGSSSFKRARAKLQAVNAFAMN